MLKGVARSFRNLCLRQFCGQTFIKNRNFFSEKRCLFKRFRGILNGFFHFIILHIDYIICLIIVRGVCFTQQKRDQFETFSKQKSPVKLKKCTLKDEGQQPTILMNSRTQLEQTNVEFAFLEIPPIENISSLPAINEHQLVTIKVVELSGEKITNTRWGAKKKREGFLVDPFSSIRIVVWDDFCNEVENGET